MLRSPRSREAASWRRRAATAPAKAAPRCCGPQIDESLRRLRTDSIALYYLHRVDPETPLEESLAAIKEYRDGGKIRHVGLSEVDVEQIERAREIVPIAAVQNHYNLSERRHEDVVDYCAREGIVVRPLLPAARRRRPARSPRSPSGTARRRRRSRSRGCSGARR